MLDWADYQFPGKTILVVEDIDTSIKFYDAALRKSMAKIMWAYDGEEAIDILENNIDDIDLILLDLNLPNINGFEVLKLLRSKNKELPVIVQTAYILSGERKISLELGANGFISKPVHLSELFINLAKYLSPEPVY